MSYSARSHVAPGDLGTSADQNQGMDNEAFLYANLRTEIAAWGAHRPSGSVGSESDEFDSTTLDAAWTAGGGAAGAGSVVENNTGAIDVYDLTSFPGWLAFQTDNSGDAVAMTDAYVRRTWSPGTGPWSVIARVGYFFGRTTGANQFIGIGFSNDTTPTNWNNIKFGRVTGSSMQVVSRNNGGSLDGTATNGYMSYYLAMVRESAGGTTSFWYSLDGITWSYTTNTASAVTPSYLWVFVHQSSSAIRPIYLVDFVRVFSTATLMVGRAGNS